MNSFENAKKFFLACEANAGWEGCHEYVAENADFKAQCEPLTEIKTVEGYVEWVKGFGTITAPGSKYILHTSSYDPENNTAIFFATIKATHTGDGGPVPPTNKTTNTDYVYVVKMNAEGKVSSMTKIWNASWAMREFGWM